MTAYQIKPSGQGINTDLKELMRSMLEKGGVDGLMLPMMQADGISVLPALITAPEEVDNAVLIGPGFPINTSRMASRLSFKPSGRKTGVWLRPCEIRAFTELVKLHQADRNELVIMGMDCPMALDNRPYKDYMAAHKDTPDHWAKMVYPDPEKAGTEVARACSVCTHPVAANADMNFLFYGSNPKDAIVVEAGSDLGNDMLGELGLEKGAVPDGRDGVISALETAREAAFDIMAGEVTAATDNLDKLETYFGACINCYNCRNVCPVCYCRECVFNTDVFSHEPVQYHQWADKWGQVKLPSDTLFYHLTRLAHMSHACVGCGQCTRACPSNIPVSDLFSVVAKGTQDAFEYTPGSDDPPPFTDFKADEYQDIVGIE